MAIRLRPLAVALAVALVAGLAALPDTRALPAQRAADFTLPRLGQGANPFSPADMRGQVWILNVWASWCTACRDEHVRLLELSRAGTVPIVGLGFRDGPREARAWLRQLGDPFVASMVDGDGRVATDYGVRAVPTTFVIDREGVVRYRHDGVLTRRALERDVLPAVRRWQR
jgi:cytochrome c biogenesis protein CcmG/thiol:disulfide interchange protein DsbE